MFGRALALVAAGAVAAASDAPTVGARLRDEHGKTLGQIEKIIRDDQGRPVQVEVRVSRVLRTLPLDALSRSGDDYVTVLSRAELQALPASD